VKNLHFNRVIRPTGQSSATTKTIGDSNDIKNGRKEERGFYSS
jgi:hypothetical protein